MAPYYITFDLINQFPATGSYGLEGFGVCQIPQAQLQGERHRLAFCDMLPRTWFPPRS